MSPASPLAAHTAAPRRWLSIVGIGEDGVEGLAPVARGLIADAEIVFGGKRHLELAGALIRGTMRPWPSPFDEAVSKVVEQRGRPVCVLASGDPFFYGVGSTAGAPCRSERDAGGAGAVVVQPRRRAARLVAAGDHAAVAAWPPARSDPPASASRRAHPGADARRRGTAGGGRAADRKRIWRIASSRCWKRSAARASTSAASAPPIFRSPTSTRSMSWRWRSKRRPARACFARTSGLADALFEHDGQITKREIRAMTLSSLAPRRARTAVGCRRRLRLGRDRMAAGRSVAARGGDRIESGSRGAHSPQCRGLRRARA